MKNYFMCIEVLFIKQGSEQGGVELLLETVQLFFSSFKICLNKHKNKINYYLNRMFMYFKRAYASSFGVLILNIHYKSNYSILSRCYIVTYWQGAWQTPPSIYSSKGILLSSALGICSCFIMKLYLNKLFTLFATLA